MLVATGWTSGFGADAAIYSPVSQTWTPVAPPPAGGRFGHAAFLLGSIEKYDAATQTWSALSPLLT